MSNQPNEEQLKAVAAFARQHGPGWKTILLFAWANGEDTRCQDGHLLRQLRNSFGPAWLKTFSLEQ